MIRRLLLGLLVLTPAVAKAQEWPTRPVSIVVAFAPGGPADVIARIIAQRLTEQMGKPFVVENRVGGGGTVSATTVVRAAPDGHTALLLTSSHAVNESLAPTRGYDLLRDLAPVAQIAETPYVLLVPPGRATTLAELLAIGRREPLNVATGGPGGLTHLLGEMLKQRTGLDMAMVHYRGNAPAINDLMAGRVDFIFDNGAASLDQARAGRLRALAVTAPQRLASAPEVPTMEEAGFTGFEVSAWLGIGVPAATPPAIIARFAEQLRQVVADPGVRTRLEAAGAQPEFRDTAAFTAVVARDIPRWREVIVQGNITAN
ncbi:Bug family tripartite tricarboxylate transporter substrate binding protein [Humitalea sp. 24SJ18S-53]|uniref:Bug family tripartite tricarboxylate transporter substrate binding protein n=1 Tax=Humitalea sp. 24SJ18S-53 TaxID=3422307 RepID=UPI003D671789